MLNKDKTKNRIINKGKTNKKRIRTQDNKNEKNINFNERRLSKKVENQQNLSKNSKNKIKENKYYTLIHMDANNSKKTIKIKSDYILNVYDNFKQATKSDVRSFWKILYVSLLYNENILYAFILNSPLEIRTLRICLVIFYYSCNLALNALFYTNSKISARYNYEGDNLALFSLINNITISVFSSLINFSIVIIFRILINPRKDFEEVFRNEENKLRKNKKYSVGLPTKKKIVEKVNSIYSCMKIKNIIFIICELLLMSFFFYFITSFCSVYKNTQVSWLLDWVTSFLLSVLLELVISLLIASLYISSITYKIELLYKITVFIYTTC